MLEGKFFPLTFSADGTAHFKFSFLLALRERRRETSEGMSNVLHAIMNVTMRTSSSYERPQWFMDISHTYVSLPQTGSHTIVSNIFVCYIITISLLRVPNLIQPDIVPVHKVMSKKTWLGWKSLS